MQLLRRDLAVEPLLQVVEQRRLEVVADQQFAIEHGFAEDIVDEIGEGAGDVVAGAREQRDLALAEDQLHADAVPFPLGREVGGVELGEILLLVDGVATASADGSARRGRCRAARALPSSQAKRSV